MNLSHDRWYGKWDGKFSISSQYPGSVLTRKGFQLATRARETGSKHDSENHSWTQILLSKSQREKAKKFHFVIFETLKITWKQNFEKLD